MLPFHRNSEGTYAANGLPKGKNITVIAIKIKDGMLQFAQRDMKVGDAISSRMAYRSLPLRDLKEELKKLNIWVLATNCTNFSDTKFVKISAISGYNQVAIRPMADGFTEKTSAASNQDDPKRRSFVILYV